jgi:endo-1,4-beta-D-glucanase Y
VHDGSPTNNLRRRAPWLLLALVAACAATPPDDGGPDPGPGGPAASWDRSRSGKGFPFGSHPARYAEGTILPRGEQGALDGAVAQVYDRWKARYVVAGCGGYIVKTGGGTGAAGALTVSEGHGYGMLATVLMAGHDPGAHEVFDGFFRVLRQFPSVNDRQLMAWAIDADCKATSGADSATDGDLDIAFALMLADRQWGSGGAIAYATEAARMVRAINRSEINAATRLPLLGDWASDPEFHTATRPSDFMLDHFRSFATLTGNPAWMATVDRIYDLTTSIHAQFSYGTGLFPDFVVGTDAMAAPAPPQFLESANDGDYGWNACRVPWRFGTDWVVAGDPRARTALGKVTAWIKGKTGGDPRKVVEGYRLDGTGLGGSDTAAFIAPFGVAAMADAANQDWLDAVWRYLLESGAQGYYEDSIRLLSMIVMSGNWWTP